MFLQECTTAEEYKELLTLMEERLRVMRQVQFHALIAAMMVMMVMMKDGDGGGDGDATG